MITMAQQNGGSTDAEVPQIDPVALNVKDEGDRRRFFVYLKRAAAEAEVPLGEVVTVNLDTEFEVPTLILGHIGPEKPEDGLERYRTIDADGRVQLPKELLEHSGDGKMTGLSLNLNLDEYDNDNRLVFEPILMEGMIALSPLGWEDGTRYTVGDIPRNQDRSSFKPRDRAADEDEVVDDVLEERTQTITEENIGRAAQMAGVPQDELAEALASIESEIEPIHLSTRVDEYDPLTVDGKTVYTVLPSEWESGSIPSLVGDDLLEAVKLAHRQQAEDLIREAGAREYRNVTREYAAVVLAE